MNSVYFRLFEVVKRRAATNDVVVYNCVETIDGLRFAVMASHIDAGNGDASLEWSRKKILLDLLREMSVDEREKLYGSLEEAIRAHEKDFF